ncbi:MAG TPA: PAS domain-containing protein [Streptosporangiaceae bacterium]|jgi:PAS domain S-box-containing protein|nr:PAS domain-containing protein [Streptosporangiaceae bacterium]
MTTPLDMRTFGHQLDAFSSRLAGLRSSSRTPEDTEAELLAAALLELETAEEELRVCHEQLETTSDQIAHRSARHERDRVLMRQVFRYAPFALFILDATGTVRQANPRAAALTGTPLEFLAGKPMPVFIDMAARAAFRSHLHAVLHTGRPAVLGIKFTGRGHPLDVQLAVSRLTGADSSHPALLAAAWAPLLAGEPVPPVFPRAAQVTAMVDGALRLELMSQVTKLLLSRAGDPGLLPEVAQLLIAEQADWAIIDLVTNGKPNRHAVAGPRGPLTTVQPECPVIRDVVAGKGPVVLDPVEDEEAFGRTPSGVPVLAAARAESLISVALPGSAGTVAGVLTVIRRDGRRGFSLADAGLFTELAAHISLALRRRDGSC